MSENNCRPIVSDTRIKSTKVTSMMMQANISIMIRKKEKWMEMTHQTKSTSIFYFLTFPDTLIHKWAGNHNEILLQFY